MDPMDYTMDDSHLNRQPNNAPRCQYAPPQLPSLNFGPHSREHNHYDPVHETRPWHTNPSTNLPNRPTFQSLHSVPQWQSTPFAPVHTWEGFGEFHPGGQSYNPDIYGQRPRGGPVGGVSNSPWNGGFEPLPFGYNAPQTELGNTTINNPVSHQSGARAISRDSSWSASARPRLTMEDLNRAQAPRSDASPLLHDHTTNQRMGIGQAVAENTSVRPAQPPSLTSEQRTAIHARSARYHSARMNHRWMDGPSGRRGWDVSDDGEDSDGEDSPRRLTTIERLYRYGDDRYSDGPDERTLAVLRGAMAVSKKVPSRAAIASLQVLKVGELTESEKTCIICYNEFGAPNPEGLVEQPLRLPKCKHIFGDTCIKKWFEDSDSCPYCRDKLPGELSSGRAIAIETVRSHRERLAAAVRRRQAEYSANPLAMPDSGDASSEMAYRRAEEAELALTTQRASMLEHSSPNRSTAGDINENRRRQIRGRNGSIRAGHALRPMSVGSARYVGSMMTHQASPQRPQISTPSEWTRFSMGQRNPDMSPEFNAYMQQRENDPYVARATQRATVQTIPRNQPVNTLSSPSEQPSPPVAVGSGEGLLRRGGEDPILGQEPTTGNMSADAPPFHPRNTDSAGPPPEAHRLSNSEYLGLHSMSGMGAAAQPRWSQ